MKKAPQIASEDQRILELENYQILDTPAEVIFDGLTQLASYICQTPVALISLVDKERQWFKSRVGLDASETPRDISFCGHAIAQDEIFIVDDSSLDIRFSDNPLTTKEPFVRFYAGTPLVTPRGEKIGTLCVIDHKPRKLTSEQLTQLKILGHQVISQIEQRRAGIELLQKNIEQKKLQDELIQSSKLTSLGAMAASIAHEINNPLAILNFSVERLKRKAETLDTNDLLNEYQKMQKTILRISTIVNGLRTISRDGRSDPYTKVPLKQIITETTALCIDKMKMQSIELITGEIPDITIECRATQISQIVLNLLNNSIDAIQSQEQKWIRIEARLENQDATICVTDSGPGIPQHIQEKIMQPFYTTKPVGQGTGLGLSLSKTIAREHHGDLTLNNHSKNTCFTLCIPIQQASGSMPNSSSSNVA